MKYCFRCGHIFNRIDNFKRHLQRKVICNSDYLDISYDTIIEEYDKYLNKFLSYKDIVDNKKNITYDELLEELLDTKQKIYQLEEENKKNQNNMKLQLESKIEELTNQLNTSNNTYNNNINNINNGNINNIIDNKIIINNFGEEKYNLTAQECESIMAQDYNMVIKLIEKIHFDNTENRNIYVRSLKEKYAGVFIDQKWKVVDRERLIEDLIRDKNILLEKLLDEHGDNFTDVSINRVKTIIDICRRDAEEIKNVRTGVRELMINRNDDILETFKFSYNKKRIKFM